MKKLRFTLLFSFILIALSSFSQKKSGEISYDVYVSSDASNASQWIDRMQNSYAELFFLDGKIRSNLFLGDVMTQTFILHKEKDTLLFLMDGMMGRLAMKPTKGDTSKMAQRYKVTNVQLIDSTKEVMGYQCKEAIVTRGSGNTVTMWYTTDIVPTYRSGQFLTKEVPGTPLEIHTSLRNGKVKIKMVAYKYKEKIKHPEKIFSLSIPKGYTFISKEQMKQFRSRGGH